MTTYHDLYPYPPHITRPKTENSYLWNEKFRLIVVRRDGFSGTVNWAGAEWHMPQDSGKSQEVTLRVGQYGFHFDPEDAPFFVTRDGFVACASRPIPIRERPIMTDDPETNEMTWRFEEEMPTFICPPAVPASDGTLQG